MDQDWSNWDDDGDYHADAGETANLGDPDEPLAATGGYGDTGYPADGADGGADGGDYSADPGGEPGAGQPGTFLEDDPMGAFGDLGDDDGTGDGDDGTGLGDGAGDGAGPDGDPDTADPAAAGTDPDPVGDPGTDADTDAGADPEAVVGADPDVDPDADWSPAEFPAPLDFAAPEPVDGYPWSDPSAVAAPGTGGDDPAAGPDGAPPAQDLLDYAGTEAGTAAGADPWAALVGSDDPAASSLGRWWAPGG